MVERPLIWWFKILAPQLIFPVLCRIFDTPKGIKYRAERPPFFCAFWSKTEYPYSAKKTSNIVRFSVDFRWIFEGGSPPGPLFEVKALRDHFLRSKVAGGRPRRLRDDFVMIFDGF